MKYKYKRVDTSTLKGLRRAERLHARGWKPISISSISDAVTLEKQEEN